MSFLVVEPFMQNLNCVHTAQIYKVLDFNS